MAILGQFLDSIELGVILVSSGIQTPLEKFMYFDKIKATALAAGVAVTTLVGAQGASAATFNFVDIADGGSFTDTDNVGQTGGEADWDTIVGAGLGILDTVSGISVVGSASASDNSSLVAYFDSGNAGLGVCGVLTGSGQCNPSNDDNVGALGGSSNSGDSTFETLILTFSESVNLTDVLFRSEGHHVFNGTVTINNTSTVISGGSWLGSLIGSVFTFQYDPIDCGGGTGCGSSNEFYIEAATVAPVPVPAAGLLLLTALGGLGVMRRRRKSA